MATDLARPAGWKNYEDFAAGIATNRLPVSSNLIGQRFALRLGDSDLVLEFLSKHEVRWVGTGAEAAGIADTGVDWCEVIEVAHETYFVDLIFASRPEQATTVVFNTRTRRALAVRNRIRGVAEAGAEPRVAQDFRVGRLAAGEVEVSGSEPHLTRDLIGLRTWHTYSPEHTYEHTYLNSERYAWQCLVGVQRGQGDVDMASYWKFDENQYIFTFREFLIPVASVFFFNFATGRSTGKFLGLTGSGKVANNPAGAYMRKASATAYPDEFGPA